MSKNLKFILLSILLIIAACSNQDGQETVKNKPENGSIDKYSAIYNKMIFEMLLHKGQIKKALEVFTSNIYLFKDEGEFLRMINHSRDLRDFDSIELILKRWFQHDSENIYAHKIAFANNIELLRYRQAEKHIEFLFTLYKRKNNKSYIDVDEILVNNLFVANVIDFFDNYLKNKDDTNLLLSYVDYLQRNSLDSIAVKYLSQVNIDNRIIIRKFAYSLSKISENERAATLIENYINKSSVTDRQISLELVSLYLSLNNLEKAISLIDKVIEIDEMDDTFIYRVALTCFDKEHYDLSEKYFNILLSKSYVPDDINFFLGQIDYEKKRFTEAIAHFNRIEQGTFLSSKHSSIARAILQKSGIDDAINYLETNKIYNESENISNLISLKILLHQELSNFSDIVNLASVGLKEDPANNRLLYSRAIAYEKLGKIDQMTADFQKMINSNPYDSIALNALGYSLSLHTNELDYAEKLIRRAIKIDPGNAAIIDSLAWVLYKKGYFKEAIKFSSLAYKKDKDPEIVEHHYFILIKNNKLIEAQQVISESIKRDPNNKSLLNLYKESQRNEATL